MNYKFDMQPRNKCNRSALLSVASPVSTGGHGQTLKRTKSTSISSSRQFIHGPNKFKRKYFRLAYFARRAVSSLQLFAPFAIICSLKYGLDQE